MRWRRLQALLAGRALLDLAGGRPEDALREPLTGPWFAPALWGASFPTRARGALIWDLHGEPWIDLYAEAGALLLGHGAPAVHRAMRRALSRRLAGASAATSLLAITLQERLEALVRPRFRRAMLCSSPEAALQFAIGLARRVTGRTAAVFVGSGNEELGPRCATLEQIVGLAPACVVVQPDALGTARRADLTALVDGCRSAGMLVVADERASALGRRGEWLAHPMVGLQADLAVLGSSLAAGACPIGACIFTPSLWERAVNDADSVIATLRPGPSPAACAAALSCLTRLQEDGLLERARPLGATWKAQLQALPARCSLVRGVECDGLTARLELSLPALLPAVHVAQTEHILVGLVEAPYTIELTPPLDIPETLLASATSRLERALQALAKGQSTT